MMKDLLARFTSRTLWVAIGTIILLVTENQYTEAAGIAIAYILGEKGLDAVQAKSGVSTASSEGTIEEDAVDTSKIVTGVGRVKATDEED